MVVVFFLVWLVAGAAGDKPHRPQCTRTTTEIFTANVMGLFYETFSPYSIHYVMKPDPNNPPSSSSCPLCDDYDISAAFDTKCTAINVTSGFDVMNIWLKIYTGISIPIYNARLYVFDHCPDIVHFDALGGGATPLRECVMATHLFQCATINIMWMVPWLLGIGITLLVTTLATATIAACFACGGGRR